MKFLRIGFALCMGVLGGMLLAQTETDFQGYMKSVVAANGALKGALKGGDLPTAKAEAKKMESGFKQMEAYFTNHKMADAAAKAKAAHEAAAATSMAATIEAATAASAGATGSCGGCHALYREKGDNGYKIKQ